MIIGNLGQDPEMRYTPSGRPLTKFSVATNRSWTAEDGKKHTETEWFNVVAWGKLAEICNQYLAKGQRVYVEGRLHTRHWTDDEGNHRSATEIVAQEMIMLDGKPPEAEETSRPDQASEDEFPF
jgi:single-strand DNA-binding protein